jgi:ABC-type multidrug transport system ATPase subunit
LPEKVSQSARMEEKPIVINVQNLSKRFGSKTKGFDVLKDISFQVRLGQVCCLLGPNGSGKTTLLKTLAGLLEPTSGTISINGVDPSKNPREARAEVGWMPAEERSGFYGRLTGRQNLTFFGALQGISLKDMERIMGNLALQIDLNSELDKTMLKVSTGAKQKIGLARALLHEPSVLLLDEPVRNLDPHAIVRFRRLLKDHLTRRQHKTILLSTHLLEEARRTADMILIIREGQIVRSIESRELESELRHSTLEELYMKTIDTAGRD